MDDADGDHVIADDTVFFHLDDKDFFCVFQDRASLFTNVVEADIDVPVEEKESGITTIVDKDWTVGGGSLGSMIRSRSPSWSCKIWYIVNNVFVGIDLILAETIRR